MKKCVLCGQQISDGLPFSIWVYDLMLRQSYLPKIQIYYTTTVSKIARKKSKNIIQDISLFIIKMETIQ